MTPQHRKAHDCCDDELVIYVIGDGKLPLYYPGSFGAFKAS